MTNVGWCEYHLHPDMIIDLETFKWKGCWACRHFHPEDDIPFKDVTETCNILNVSRSTVIRWVNKGKLDGRLFERGRHLNSISPPHKIYFIYNDSIDNLKNQLSEKSNNKNHSNKKNPNKESGKSSYKK